MRTSRSIWTLPIAVIALLGGCAPAPPATPAVDQAAIGAAVDSLTNAFAAACAARDTSAVVALYADDAHLMPPNAPRSDGKEAIRQAWAGFLATPGMELTPASNTKIISEAGDMVVDLGSYLFKWQDAKGGIQSDAGKYVTVYRKVNGEWKIVVDAFNSDLAIPGM